MISGVSSPPKSREAIKTSDREYRRTQLHVLEQCTPGDTFHPEAQDARMVTVFKAMAAERLLIDIGDGLYVLTAKGQEHRRRLRRWRWWQAFRDNLNWLVPTFVAICSVVVAALALAANSGGTTVQ